MGENIVIEGEGEFGAGLPFFEKLQLLAEWAPVLGRLQAITSASSPQERATAIVKALQWAAGKSATTVDDEALFHLEAVLRSPEGKAFFDWVVTQVTE
jgi:hypothetical protein